MDIALRAGLITELQPDTALPWGRPSAGARSHVTEIPS